MLYEMQNFFAIAMPLCMRAIETLLDGINVTLLHQHHIATLTSHCMRALEVLLKKKVAEVTVSSYRKLEVIYSTGSGFNPSFNCIN